MTSTIDPATADATVLVVTGQGPLDRLGRLVHADDPAAQLALALANLEDALTRAGLVPAELVDVTVRTTDVDAVLAVLDTLTERFGEVEAGPATTVLRVDALPVPGQVVALDARAARSTTADTTDTPPPRARDRPARPRKRRTAP